MATLEPQIITYLKKNGPTHQNVIVDHFNSQTNIENNKIVFRINKLISQDKLSEDHGLISLPKPEYNLPKKLDEEFNYGPIKLCRKGKKVFIQSNWKKEEHEKFMTSIKESLPILKEELTQQISSIEQDIIKRFDPLDVLAYISAKNFICNPETYTESSFEGKQLLPEIVQNLILKNNLKSYKEKTNREVIPEIEPPLNDLINKLNQYVMYDSMFKEGLSDIEKEIYSNIIIRFLNIRGDAYPLHYKMIALELFGKINSLLKSKGFTIEEYYQTIEEITKQIDSHYNLQKKIKAEHEIFNELYDFKKKKADVLKEYLKTSKTRRKDLQAEKSELGLKGSFEIDLNKSINKKVLNLLTLEFGCNNQWSSPLLDKSDVPIKPIVKAMDKYYCFITPHLIRNVIPIIESILTLQEKDSVSYPKIKGEYFEQKTLDLFKKLLPSSKIYPKLYYPNGEIDGIVIQGKDVILVEVKGKKKRIIVGQQDLLALSKEDFKRHIDEAYVQSKRTLEYIQSKNTAIFKDEKKNIVLTLKQTDIENIYLANVSLDNFSDLATDLNLVKLWDPKLLKGNIYPWPVSIYDLIVISDLIERPEDFIDYLAQRIKISRDYELKAMDELDFLGYYLDNGSLTKNADIKSFQSPVIHGYTEEIDRWYSYLSGEIKSAKKPVKKR